MTKTQVNFWNKITILSINGIVCGERNTTVLLRGIEKDSVIEYERPKYINSDNFSEFEKAADGILKCYGIYVGETFFTKKKYYYTELINFYINKDNWNKLVDFNGRLFKDRINSVKIVTKYVKVENSVPMKELREYPVELVIDFLKERGVIIYKI